MGKKGGSPGREIFGPSHLKPWPPGYRHGRDPRGGHRSDTAGSVLPCNKRQSHLSPWPLDTVMAGTRGQGTAQIPLKASSPTTTDRHTRNPRIPELRPKIDQPWQSSPKSHASTERRERTTNQEIAGRPGTCKKNQNCPELPEATTVLRPWTKRLDTGGRRSRAQLNIQISKLKPTEKTRNPGPLYTAMAGA